MGNVELSKTELFANRYELQAEIGSGGMGVIYRAKDRLTGKLVALKQLPPASEFILTTHISDDDSTTARIALAREFEILAALHHPHIIQVQDYGFWQGDPYFTMMLLEHGQDIKSYAKNLNLPQKVDLILQVLESLAYLHQRGILHHDIKPTNILVKDGHVYLLDFGLSIEHGLQHLRLAGTMTYLAPEIVLHKASSIASDLYSVGVVLYELITGKRPYQARRISDLIDEIVNGTPDFNLISELEYGRLPHDAPILNVPYEEPDQLLHDEPTQVLDYPAKELNLADLDTLIFENGQFLSPLAKVIKQMLAKRPEERYPDAQSVIDALNQALRRPPLAETEAIRESYLQAAHFVGRASEHNQLTDALLASLSGEGSFWLISGESGVGKSRLVSEIERLAKVWGAVVLRGSGEQFNHMPYQYWREPLRRLILAYEISELDASILKTVVPDIEMLLQYSVDTPDILESNNEDQRLIFTITDLFNRATSPVVLILEDLHWASESLKILQALSRQVEQLPLLILGTYQSHIRPDLPETLPNCQVIRLECFAKPEISELTEAILGQNKGNTKIINFLSQETEGNAFFIVETLRALAEESGGLRKVTDLPLPASLTTSGIRAAIMARLMRYPAKFRSLLVLAAVIGRQLDTHLLWHIVQAESSYAQEYPNYKDFIDWLNKSANASILRIANESWQFTHDKLREVILDALDAEQWRTLHQIVAQGYETLYSDNDDYAATLHYHWQQAQNVPKEIAYALATARQLSRISEHHEAIRYAEEGLAKLTQSDDAYRACFNDVLGRAYLEIGFHQQAAAYLEESITFAQKANDEYLETRASTILGWVYSELNQMSHAQETLEQAIQLAEHLQDDQLKADALVQYGAFLNRGEEKVKALDVAEEAIQIYQRHNNYAGLGRAYNVLATHNFYTEDYQRAKDYLILSQASLEKCGDRWMLAAILNNLGVIHRKLDDLAKAEETAHQALAIFERLGSDWGIMIANVSMLNIGFDREDALMTKFYLKKALKISSSLENLIFITTHLCLAAYYFKMIEQYPWVYKIIGLCLNYDNLGPSDRADCEELLIEMENILDAELVDQYLQEGAQGDIKTFAEEVLQQLG